MDTSQSVITKTICIVDKQDVKLLESYLTLGEVTEEYPGMTKPAVFRRITDFTNAGHRPAIIATK